LDDLSKRADRLADQQRDFANRLGQAFGRAQNGQNPQPGRNGGGAQPSPIETSRLADEKDKMAAALDQMEKDMQKAARDLAGTQPGASARVRDGLSDIQQNETKMRMQYSARFIRQGQGQFMVDREGPITQALDQMSKDLKAAQSALNANGGQQGGNKEAEQSLARLERLRSQMQQMAQAGQNGQGGQQGGNQQGGSQAGGNQAGGNQAGGQQGGNLGGGRLNSRGRNSGGFGGYGRFQQEGVFEVPDIQYADPGAIVRDAQMQLNDLREQFRDNPDLGREIQDLSRELSRLQVGQTASPELDARIGREILPKLEALEVQLRRQAGEAETGQVRSGASDRVPAGYTDAVAEYFRKLSKGR
jgi:hypothetical protein